MATVNKETLLTRLNIELGDASNITFSEVEKNEMLRKAAADHMVYTVTEETVPVTGLRSYLLDDTHEQVIAIGYDASGDGFPTELPGDAYDVVNGSVILDRRYMNLVAGQDLYLQVAKKWTIEDEIPDYLGEYILELAVVFSGRFLANKKVNLFLRNKTTMGELMARINEAKQTVREMRKGLQNQKFVRV